MSGNGQARVGVDLSGAWEYWLVWDLPEGLTPDQLQAEIQSRLDDGTFWENAELKDSGNDSYTLSHIEYA